MKDIVVTMKKDAYDFYMNCDNPFKDRKQLIEYLNCTGNYLGNVVDIAIEKEE